eukprot:jgi/Chlat1/309/Chrsp1S00216
MVAATALLVQAQTAAAAPEPSGLSGWMSNRRRTAQSRPRRAVLSPCTGIVCTLERPSSEAQEAADAATVPPPSPSESQKKPRKRRLDEVCLELHPNRSRTIIQSWILQGKCALTCINLVLYNTVLQSKVRVDGVPVTKAGSPTSFAAIVEVFAEEPKFVCRAGFKLESALDHFGIDVSSKVVMDAGLSTGGFTDCLLQRGAAHVYGVDVGYGQVCDKIRNDSRVVVMERTNLRHLRELPEPVDMVTLDLSFISVLLVMDAVAAVLKPGGDLVVLIKPQFEARREQVGKGGIVRDAHVHDEVISRVVGGITSRGFTNHGWLPSPTKGTDGNQEFLAHFTRKDAA